ncbi:MAG: FUSC family protein [Gaiellales bacterium]
MLDKAALKTAARAAIVMPAVFAFADTVIGQPQTSIFAAFGSFAMLVLVDVEGPPLPRMCAYLALTAVGATFITIGTLCSRNAWLGAGVMAVIGFCVLMSGVINGYIAALSTGALLTFVLPVTIPAPNSAIPDRLEGWALAAGAGICAVMLLWPSRRRADLQHDAARAMRAVAQAAAVPDGADVNLREARDAVDRLGRRSLGSQHRPTGPTGRTAALAALPDELDWLLSFLGPPVIASGGEQDAEAMAATAAVLMAGAERLDGRDERPDFQRLDAARAAVAQAEVRRLLELPADASDEALREVVEPPFRIRAATYSARQLGGYALRATGADAPELDQSDVAQPSGGGALEATERLAAEHAGLGSIWFRNSVRGAVGLAVAVFIAQRTGLQHGFWVVLGTLSVLRSNALATGWSVLSALAGTAAGIVLGALLVIAIGTHQAVLWGVLPIAVLVAAYAPRGISFAAGQAGFTVVLFVLFNLIQPVGWSVGLVRVEDVAIGFAISLGVGVLFWPRGAASLLRDHLATAFGRGSEYVVATARESVTGAAAAEAARAARAADGAAHRLDDAFRLYLAERSAGDFKVEEVAAFVGGAGRVRRAGQSLAALGQMADPATRLQRCGENLDRELHALHAWFAALGYAIVNRGAVPPPHIRDDEGRSRLLICVRDAVRTGDDGAARAALLLLWTSQHIDNLWRLEAHLGERADAARGGEAG